MQADLEGLEISRRELKYLSGIAINRVYWPLTLKKIFQEGLKTLLTMGLLLLSYRILITIFPSYQIVLVVIHGIAGLGLIVDDTLKIITSLRHKSLIAISIEVDRYNKIIQALTLCDQLENIGNPTAKVVDRPEIINALTLIREELVRTLNTERMIRNHHSLVKQSANLFPCDLSSLTIPQWQYSNNPKSEILREAWDIIISVEAMAKTSQKR